MNHVAICDRNMGQAPCKTGAAEHFQRTHSLPRATDTARAPRCRCTFNGESSTSKRSLAGLMIFVPSPAACSQESRNQG